MLPGKASFCALMWGFVEARVVLIAILSKFVEDTKL